MPGENKKACRESVILLFLGIGFLALASISLVWAGGGPAGEPLAEVLRTKIEYEDGVHYPDRILADVVARWSIVCSLLLFLGAFATWKKR
jgi:uncharacterized membrane protein YphA (DoxX/SURF4 family)